MGVVEDRLAELGITLPTAQAPAANYVPAVKTGNLLYLSGVGPASKPDGTTFKGKVGQDLSVEDGYQAARLVGVNLIARMREEVGDLDKIERVVKLLGMVNATPEFSEHPSVINGCSDLLVEVFGDKGRHARSAVGFVSLPFHLPVEIEMIVQVKV